MARVCLRRRGVAGVCISCFCQTLFEFRLPGWYCPTEYPAFPPWDVCPADLYIFFFQAEDGIRYWSVTGVQTCALPISWYFAEGRAGADFQEFLALENPDPIQTAHVRVQYLFQGHTGPTILHNVPPQSRYTDRKSVV